MTRVILQLLIFFIVVGGFAAIISAVIYFWLNVRRQWQREDEEFNAEKRREAMDELIQTNRMLAETKEDYINNRGYKSRTAEELLEKR